MSAAGGEGSLVQGFPRQFHRAVPGGDPSRVAGLLRRGQPTAGPVVAREGDLYVVVRMALSPQQFLRPGIAHDLLGHAHGLIGRGRRGARRIGYGGR